MAGSCGMFRSFLLPCLGLVLQAADPWAGHPFPQSSLPPLLGSSTALGQIMLDPRHPLPNVRGPDSTSLGPGRARLWECSAWSLVLMEHSMQLEKELMGLWRLPMEFAASARCQGDYSIYCGIRTWSFQRLRFSKEGPLLWQCKESRWLLSLLFLRLGKADLLSCLQRLDEAPNKTGSVLIRTQSMGSFEGNDSRILCRLIGALFALGKAD